MEGKQSSFFNNFVGSIRVYNYRTYNYFTMLESASPVKLIVGSVETTGIAQKPVFWTQYFIFYQMLLNRTYRQIGKHFCRFWMTFI